MNGDRRRHHFEIFGARSGVNVVVWVVSGYYTNCVADVPCRPPQTCWSSCICSEVPRFSDSAVHQIGWAVLQFLSWHRSAERCVHSISNMFFANREDQWSGKQRKARPSSPQQRHPSCPRHAPLLPFPLHFSPNLTSTVINRP